MLFLDDLFNSYNWILSESKIIYIYIDCIYLSHYRHTCSKINRSYEVKWSMSENTSSWMNFALRSVLISIIKIHSNFVWLRKLHENTLFSGFVFSKNGQQIIIILTSMAFQWSVSILNFILNSRNCWWS